MNVASARPIRQPCGEGKAGDEKVIGRARSLPAVPTGRPASAASGCLRAVRITHGCMDRCLRAVVGAGDGAPCPRRLPLARISPPCPRGDPHEAASEKAPRKASHSRHAAPTGRPPPPTGTAHDAADAVPVGFLRDTGHPRMPPESSLRHCFHITIAT